MMGQPATHIIMMWLQAKTQHQVKLQASTAWLHLAGHQVPLHLPVPVEAAARRIQARLMRFPRILWRTVLMIF